MRRADRAARRRAHLGLTVVVIGAMAHSGALGATKPDPQVLIDRAIARRATSVRLPPGVLRIERPLRIGLARNLVVDGRRTTIVMSNPTAGALLVEGARDVTVRGLTVDYSPLPFTQGRVVAVNPRDLSYDIAVSRGYPARAEPFAFQSDVHFRDAASGNLDRETGSIFGVSVTSPRAGVLRVRAADGVETEFYRVEVGDVAAIGSRWSACAVEVRRSRNTLLDGVRVLAAPGCGVGDFASGATRARVAVEPGPPPPGAREARLLSSNRDGIHVTAPLPAPQIFGSRLVRNGDDGINIESPFGRVVAVGPGRIRVGGAEMRLRRGDPLRAYDPATGSRRGAVRITRAERNGWLRVSGDALGVGDRVVDPAFSSGATVRDTFVAGAARCGIIVRGRRSRILRNRIADTEVCGIWAGPEIGGFDEGDAAEDVVIAENRLERIGMSRNSRGGWQQLLGAISVVASVENPATTPGPSSARPNRRIRVERNRVDTAASFGVFLSGVTSACISGNTIVRPLALDRLDAGKAFGLEPGSAIGIRDSDRVSLNGNVTDGTAFQFDGPGDRASAPRSGDCRG
ncbi:MAG: hypothetical protein HYX33_02015 [Actinobacteria bacterium]|nr:hypothetical protein [Actinomycetota bacterium]